MTFAYLFENDPKHKENSRYLRRNQTKAEWVLWYELRGKKLGYKFRRQFNISNFIVDFYCNKLRLILEIDGPIHDYQKGYDAYRENVLKKKKFHVIRFKNDEVLFEREWVMEEIKIVCEELATKKKGGCLFC